MDIKPHPDCRAPHRDSTEYVGPTHACAGEGCEAPEHGIADNPSVKLNKSGCACTPESYVGGHDHRHGIGPVSDLNTVRHAEHHGIPEVDLQKDLAFPFAPR